MCRGTRACKVQRRSSASWCSGGSTSHRKPRTRRRGWSREQRWRWREGMQRWAGGVTRRLCCAIRRRPWQPRGRCGYGTSEGEPGQVRCACDALTQSGCGESSSCSWTSSTPWPCVGSRQRGLALHGHGMRSSVSRHVALAACGCGTHSCGGASGWRRLQTRARSCLRGSWRWCRCPLGENVQSRGAQVMGLAVGRETSRCLADPRQVTRAMAPCAAPQIVGRS